MNYVRIFLLIACTSSSMLMLGFSTQEPAGEPKEQQKINFYGILVDTNHEKYRVENISIAGAYENIELYKKPLTPEGNPPDHTDIIDLIDVAIIRRPTTTEEPHTYTFNKREYIEIEVVFTDGTEHRYIIEKSKKILCNELSNGEFIKKKIAFEALAYLKIQGHVARDEDKEKVHTTCPDSATLSEDCTHELEQVFTELQKDIYTTLESHKEKLLQNISTVKKG